MRSRPSIRRCARLLLHALPAFATAAEMPAVTAASLFENERLWPYRVTLIEPWQPADREEPLKVGSSGVLIRVEPRGVARIDFSAEGKRQVPIERTDLVESANRIRRGELAKQAPNFVHAIATRLVDSASGTLAGLSPEAIAGRPGFLCVFTDPDDEAFEALAVALAPLRDRHGVVTVLFPQGTHPDARTRERLRSLGWTVPFLYDFLSEPYTRTLIDESTTMPAVLLQTDEGRVVYQGGLRADDVQELTAALDAAFGSAPVPAVATGAGGGR